MNYSSVCCFRAIRLVRPENPRAELDDEALDSHRNDFILDFVLFCPRYNSVFVQ